MAILKTTIQHEAGLHARPLAQFVKTVKEYDAEVQVTNITRGKGPVSGASPVKLLLLAVLKAHEVEIEASGPQAEEVLVALDALIQDNFGEA
ncbi:MAG TPA: HPr family phosphocarrier protein [Anaerolineales bacterium]|nr:HPr family phosphocarrier protein [Anaerolineales bacterium]HRQ93359.1 HPr family phosphocarrier protein [Anaerolineales bacterium]